MSASAPAPAPRPPSPPAGAPSSPVLAASAAAQPPSFSSSPSPSLSPPFLSPGQLPGGSASPFLSAPTSPAFPSPLRQHRRTPSQHREVKETLNAVSEFADEEEDGFAHHKINQYTIKAMIGRGSYGAVHLATDQYGTEYAVKEFSKARLRKRARSNIMKQGPFLRAGRFPGAGWAGGAQGDPSARLDGEAQAEAKDALYLIRAEIAIMKKLNHPNLVELIEVLDDPEQDSLYMVLEMCNKGVIMDVGLGKTAQPYDAEACRCWFRDLILGIEYLHAQNIIHRDIKPDNLLITADDVLKIADFGVSEIFEKPEGMRTSKTVGSPAFLPPELCVSNHGDVAGPPCDIWSMGVTLYCLRYGRIPFEHETIPEMYAAINDAHVALAPDEDPDFVDLMHRIFAKDPAQRITMAALREHPWVTLHGADPLLSAEENCAHTVEPPNELELNHAFTRRMSHLLCVLRAIGKFKGLLHSRSQDAAGAAGPSSSLASDAADFGSRVASLAVSSDGGEDSRGGSSCGATSGLTTAEEVARLVEERRSNLRKASLHASLMRETAEDGEGVRNGNGNVSGGGSGGGRESGSGIGADRPTLLLGIGTGGADDFGDGAGGDGVRDGASSAPVEGVVSESPTAADFDVYDRAFQSEVQRIQRQNSHSTLYATKVLERRNRRFDASLYGTDSSSSSSSSTAAAASAAAASSEAVDRPSAGGEAGAAGSTGTEGSTKMVDVVARLLKEAKS